MSTDVDIDQLGDELRHLDAAERSKRMEQFPTGRLVKLVGSRWRSVGDYAFGPLRRRRSGGGACDLVMDALETGEFRRQDSRVRGLNFLVCQAARSERAKAVYRKFLDDKNTGVVSCAIPGSVWSLDEEALPVLERILKATEDEYLLKKIPLAIKAIQERDPRMLEGGRLDPADWGLSLPPR